MRTCSSRLTANLTSSLRLPTHPTYSPLVCKAAAVPEVLTTHSISRTQTNSTKSSASTKCKSISILQLRKRKIKYWLNQWKKNKSKLKSNFRTTTTLTTLMKKKLSMNSRSKRSKKLRKSQPCWIWNSRLSSKRKTYLQLRNSIRLARLWCRLASTTRVSRLRCSTKKTIISTMRKRLTSSLKNTWTRTKQKKTNQEISITENLTICQIQTTIMSPVWVNQASRQNNLYWQPYFAYLKPMKKVQATNYLFPKKNCSFMTWSRFLKFSRLKKRVY